MDLLMEVDETMDLDIQVGGKPKEQLLIPESTLTSKYRSVIVKGFRAETSLESILEILSQYELPADYYVVKNEQSGSLTVENLKPENCLTLIEKMNKKRFLNRQIYVTSVVSDSPIKPAVQVKPPSSAVKTPSKSITDPAKASQSHSEDHLPPNLTLPNPHVQLPPSPNNLAPDPFSDFVFFDSSVSPTVQQKISKIEKQASTSAACKPRPDKRKPDSSPETDELSKKERKILREKEKLRKKLEYKEKNAVQLQHSF